jgi:hypothetical protein
VSRLHPSYLQPAFPAIALDGRLASAQRPLRSALLAMHHPIGASTGWLPGSRYDWTEMIRRACEVSTFAVELSALQEGELPGLIAFLEDRPRLPFHYLSVHAPTKGRDASEAKLAATLAKLPAHVAAVVVHPDQVEDPDAWRVLGHRLVLENMDTRKARGQTAEDLAPLFAELPDAGFCFDIAHASAVDESMELAHALLDAYGARLRHVHLSSLRLRAGVRSTHVPLYRRDEHRFAPVLRRCPDVPWILEAAPPRR